MSGLIARCYDLIATSSRRCSDVCINDFWFRDKHNLVVYISPSLRAHISSTSSPNMNFLKIWQQKVENVKSIIIGNLNVSSIRSKFVLTKNAMKTFDVFPTVNQNSIVHFQQTSFVLMSSAFLGVTATDLEVV